MSTTHTLEDALSVLASCIGVMDARMDVPGNGIADAARTLLRIAHTSLKVAIDGDTLDLKEEAASCVYEANAVLKFAAREADDSATWGALTLLGLVWEMVGAAIQTAMAVKV